MSGDTLAVLAVALAASWASGVNAYADRTGAGSRPAARASSPCRTTCRCWRRSWVLAAAALLFALNFLADKIPLVDSINDVLHTFVRIPAGALLAFGATDSLGPEASTIAALLGGTLAAGTHVAKTGTRALINTSPEPFSNIAASLAGDGIVIGGLILALAHPITFLCLLALFVVRLCLAAAQARAVGDAAISPHGAMDGSNRERSLSFAAAQALNFPRHHVHPPEHPDPAVLPHDAGDALSVSAAPAGDQARHRAERTGRDLPARHPDRCRFPPLAPLRLQAVVRRLPGLRAGAHPRARFRTQQGPAPHPAPQRARPRDRGPGAGDRRAVRAFLTLRDGPSPRRRHGRHGLRRLSRDGRGEPGRDGDHRVPRRLGRRPAGRRGAWSTGCRAACRRSTATSTRPIRGAASAPT